MSGFQLVVLSKGEQVLGEQVLGEQVLGEQVLGEQVKNLRTTDWAISQKSLLRTS